MKQQALGTLNYSLLITLFQCTTGTWRDSPVVKSIYCSSRQPGCMHESLLPETLLLILACVHVMVCEECVCVCVCECGCEIATACYWSWRTHLVLVLSFVWDRVAVLFSTVSAGRAGPWTPWRFSCLLPSCIKNTWITEEHYCIECLCGFWEFKLRPFVLLR